MKETVIRDWNITKLRSCLKRKNSFDIRMLKGNLKQLKKDCLLLTQIIKQIEKL